jgi:TonB family protein
MIGGRVMLRVIAVCLGLTVIRPAMSDRPEPAGCVRRVESLEYPQLARTASIEGMVVVQVKIGPSGNVLEVRGLSGPPILQRAALTNAKTWRFDSGAARTIRITYEFRLTRPAVDYIPPTKVTFDLPVQVMVTSPSAKPTD